MKKVLIVHTSKTGTTKDAAAMIAKEISWPCDIYDCCTGSLTQVNGETQSSDNPSITSYDTVVVGTAIYMGMPLRKMRQFCKRHKSRLQSRKLIFFTCGIGSKEWDQKSLFKSLPASLKSHASYYFHVGGEIRERGLNAFERAAMRGYLEQNGVGPGIDQSAIAQLAEAVKEIS